MWAVSVQFLHIVWHRKEGETHSEGHQKVQPTLHSYSLRYCDHVPILDVELMSYMPVPDHHGRSFYPPSRVWPGPTVSMKSKQSQNHYSPRPHTVSIRLEISWEGISRRHQTWCRRIVKPQSNCFHPSTPKPIGKGYYEPPQAAGPCKDLPPFLMEECRWTFKRCTTCITKDFLKSK